MKTGFIHLALVSSALAIAPVPNYQQAKQTSKYVPNAYIVELSDAATSRRSLSSPHDAVYTAISNSGILFHTISEYNTPEILVGASIRLVSPSDVARLAKIPGVQSIRPVIKVAAPKPLNVSVVQDPTAGLPDTYSPHVMTGVDKVHATGNFGQGIKIGIIDTGIDYFHPDLGGGFGPGFKVIGGYDFVGDKFNGDNYPTPDDDPLDECNGHGSHVAGILGANPDSSVGISGVASSASLASYRIFGCSGFTTDDIIISAMILAYNQKMDILTLSLGGASGWTEGTASVVASRIAEQGRIVTIAAGNDGQEGAWYTSDPGAGIGAISVASVDNIASPVQNLTVHGAEHDPIPYFMPLPLNATGEYPIYVTSTNTSKTNDACDALPNSTPDLSLFVVVIHRGTCAFTQKLANIAAKGAKLALIYNSDGGTFSPIAVGTFKAVLIPAADGKFLVQQSLTNPNLTVSFPQSGAAFSVPNPAGGLMSVFSSIGPTFDMHLSPALAAPGGNILSTFPLKLGGYALESGTSMATPFVAGAAALILQALGKTAKVALNMRSILQSTAGSVPSSHTDSTPLRTVAQQGAGLIQVDRAINAKSIISPSQIALNDTAHFKANHTISITNLGATKKVYELRHVPAETIDTVASDSGFVNIVPEVVPGTASVAFSTAKVTVGPGNTKHIVATFTPPATSNTSVPVYSGFIQIASADDSESLKVTYLGVAASLKGIRVLDNTDEFFGLALPAVVDSNGNPQEGPANYTFIDEDFPFLLFRFAFGTAKLRIDLVDKDIRVPPSVNRRSEFSWWWTQSTAGTFDKIKTIGPLAELEYVSRSSSDPFSGYSTLPFSGQFANGTRINDGQYRALLRALKVTGNPNKEEDYETWLSPQFGVITPA